MTDSPTQTSPLDRPVTELPGVGPKRASHLERLGIRTVRDLLRHAPRGYEDRGGLVSVREARTREPGRFAVVRGRVAKRHLRRLGRRRSTLRVLLEDESDRLEALWFNAPFLADELPVGARVFLSGRLTKDGALLQPELARVADGESVPDRLTGIRPIYPLTEG